MKNIFVIHSEHVKRYYVTFYSHTFHQNFCDRRSHEFDQQLHIYIALCIFRYSHKLQEGPPGVEAKTQKPMEMFVVVLILCIKFIDGV